MSVTLATNLTVSGTAGSLITALDAFLVTALSWTKPYTSTNIAVYKQPAGSNGMYLRVDDTATTTSLLRAYETMSGHSTGTGPFPTVAQSANGLLFTKSDAASSSTRPSILLSNGKLLMMFVSYTVTAWSQVDTFIFGDCDSRKPSDAFCTMLMAGSPSNVHTVTSGLSGVTTGHYMARAHTQLGSAIQFGKFTDSVRNGSSGFGNGGPAYPSPVSGRLNLTPLYANEPSATDTRAQIPGIFSIAHNAARPRTHGDTDTGSGALSGRTFMYINVGVSTYQCAVETSSTW